MGDDRYEPPFRQFAFPSGEGAVWEWRGKIGSEPAEYASRNEGLEEVEVPLGTFEAFRVRQTDSGQTDFWLVRGIGVVKLAGKTWDEHDPAPEPGSPLYFDWRLKEFTRGGE